MYMKNTSMRYLLADLPVRIYIVSCYGYVTSVIASLCTCYQSGESHNSQGSTRHLCPFIRF